MGHEIFALPIFGVAISVAAHNSGLALSRRYPRLHPLFFSAGSIIVVLLLFRIPYEDYNVGGELLTFFLGPATVALGVPLYKYRVYLKQHMAAACTGISVGAVTGIVSAGLCVWLLGGTKMVMLSMLPKSVSSPISIELSRLIGGIPELSAVLTVMAGLLGSMFGRALLLRLGINGAIPIGIAIGTAAHGIGTAKLIRHSELEGSISAFSMALTGIVTALLFIPIVWWLG